MEKQDAFTQALLRAMDAAEQEAGVRQPRLRRAVEQYGGISAVSAKFNASFTDDEVNHCFAQLCAANYFGKARF